MPHFPYYPHTNHTNKNVKRIYVKNIKNQFRTDLNRKGIITSALYFYRHQQTGIPSSTLPSFPIDWPSPTCRMQKAPPSTYSFGVQVH